MRLIDGEALWEKCYDFHLELNETDTEIEKSAKTLAEILVRQSIRRMIDAMPTIDTEVYYCNWVERNGRYWCSECNSRRSSQLLSLLRL